MSRRIGFTFLEVLIAIVILSNVTIMIWTTLSNSFRMRDKLEEVEDRTHVVRMLFTRLDRDLSMAYLVKEKKYHTVFIGKDEGDSDALTFTTFSNRVYGDEEVPQADQNIVFYYTETNQEKPDLVDVYRWSYPFIEDDQYWGEKRGTIILERVRQFDMQYYDGSQYKDDWDTQLAEFVGKMPRGVKVLVELEEQRRLTDLFTIPLNKPLAAKEIKAPAKQETKSSNPSTTDKESTPTTSEPKESGADSVKSPGAVPAGDED